MAAETAFDFTGAAGQKLAGRLARPAGPMRGAAVLAHCFTCGKDLRSLRILAGRLVAEGFAVLRFDFTGIGRSGGELAEAGVAANAGDLEAAARALAAEGLAPGLLVGHSLGGAAVLLAAGRIESVRAVATIGAPADAAHVLKHLGCALDRVEQEGRAPVTIAGRRFEIGRRFVEEARGAAVEEAVARMRRALLILHAPGDAVVGIEHAARLFKAARHPKSFVSLDRADHLLSRPEDAEYAASVIAAWAGRYLPAPPEPVTAPPEGITRVREADPTGFLQHIRAGRHALTADEPASVGGTDLGPSPYQLLTAALGACTAMTIRMYARRKGWPLAGVEVDVSHERQHAADCGGGEGCRIDVFRRVIRLEGDLDEAQRARLAEIADRCPVHRTLSREARIETELAPPDAVS
ncbi:MAG: OsmC family protein [Alphaproteobacteria bacterium]|nr:MAG: OsmC family protein [Alphaproteobacteria bacterium]